MYSEIIGNVREQLRDLAAPARSAQSVMVEHVANLTEFQLESARGYTELGLQHLRELQAIDSTRDLQGIVSKQTELMQTLGEKLSRDLTTLAELQQSFSEKLQGLGRTNAARSTSRRGKTTRKATGTTGRSTGRKSA